jgi:hypothetical protein
MRARTDQQAGPEAVARIRDTEANRGEPIEIVTDEFLELDDKER